MDLEGDTPVAVTLDRISITDLPLKLAVPLTVLTDVAVSWPSGEVVLCVISTLVPVEYSVILKQLSAVSVPVELPEPDESPELSVLLDEVEPEEPLVLPELPELVDPELFELLVLEPESVEPELLVVVELLPVLVLDSLELLLVLVALLFVDSVELESELLPPQAANILLNTTTLHNRIICLYFMTVASLRH